MNVRELLQTEIWSKETSRKVLAPARKYLVPSRRVVVRVGIVLGIIVALAGIALTVEILWLTNGERKAATEALAKIDALQNLMPVGGNDFNEQDQRAKGTVKEAEQRAWTIRDSAAAFGLSGYLGTVESDQRIAEMETKSRAIVKARGGVWHSDPDLDKELAASKVQVRLVFRSGVLKAMRQQK